MGRKDIIYFILIYNIIDKKLTLRQEVPGMDQTFDTEHSTLRKVLSLVGRGSSTSQHLPKNHSIKIKDTIVP